VLALVGSVFLYAYLRQLDHRVSVVVAARDLARHEQLGTADVRVAYIHPSGALADGFRSTSPVVGRWVTHEIMAGEQVTGARLTVDVYAGGSYGLGLAYRGLFVPCGFARAAGGAIWEGDRVDVVAVTSSRSEPVAYRVAQDLEVLEVRDEQGARVRVFGSAEGLGGVLVAVPDAIAEALVLAMSCGQVYLMLRDPMPVAPGSAGQ
jgi:pilus assembly protein CpaB